MKAESRLLQVIQRLGLGAKTQLGANSAIVRCFRPAYESMLRYLAGDNGIPWHINGIPCRIDPAFRARMALIYEPAVAEFLIGHVKPGSICLNIGANVGIYALQLAFWSAPSGRVIAFEPNPESARILKDHIRMNGLDDRVEIVQKAIGGESGLCDFYVTDTDGRSRAGMPNPEIQENCKEIQVAMTTIDEYCERNALSPDWLFVDIEGYEISALKGASRTILNAAGQIGIVVEMHPGIWEASGTSRQEAESLLASMRLRPIPLTNQTDPLSEHGVVYLECCQ